MNADTIRDYLHRAEMNEAQANALSRIFAEMATKGDVLRLEERIRAELGILCAEMGATRADLRSELADMRSEPTWKLIAIVGFFATVSTLLNLFVG